MTEKMSFGKIPQSVEEEQITVSIPLSTWQLFQAVSVHPVGEASECYLDQMKASMAAGNEKFPLPDVFKNLGNKRGSVRMGSLEDSVFYPGTSRKYWVYLPADTDPEEKLNLVLILDANFFMYDSETGKLLEDPGLLRMFDNLIAEKKIPPTAVLLAEYGTPGPGQPVNGYSEGRVNRSVEYDTTSDRHARFLTEELMPAALDGCTISPDPKDHIICGFSSSGVAAFCAAWFRPEVFGNVFHGSGSFVNIRNGIVWPSVIRISPRKPIRVFGTAGKHDLDNIFGSWLTANTDVACALHYADYENLFYITEAGHSLPVFYRTLPEGIAWLFGGKEPEFEYMKKIDFAEVIR
ncbi:MAG: hypothetical protein HUJ73_06170 [Eubacterium sp.]|nr:hypothetical protein [Eubacterium sp.]